MNEDAGLDDYWESQYELPEPWYEDDFEQLNQNEALDYVNEGYDDYDDVNEME
jgi:uncharacterized protein YbdZ (MbtH family)